MTNITRLGVIIALLLIVFSFFIGRYTKQCKTDVIYTKVTTPEITHKFDSPQVFVPETNAIKSIIKYKDTTIFIPQVNQELLDKYIALENENDSNKKELIRLKMYSDAVSIKEYNTPFEDKNIKLNVYSKIQGQLLEQKPEYTIKSQDLTIPVTIPKPKEKVFSMNVGAGITTTKQLDKIDPSVHLDLINKKGNILSASYSIDGVIGVKYSVPLFSIKK